MFAYDEVDGDISSLVVPDKVSIDSSTRQVTPVTYEVINSMNQSGTANAHITVEGKFTKISDKSEVVLGDNVKYTFDNFANCYNGDVNNYVISDTPDKGLEFIGVSTSAFTKGEGITFNVKYKTNLGGNAEKVLATGLSASETHNILMPNLNSGEYVTNISLEFGTVPKGFGIENQVLFAFRVEDNYESDTIRNIGRYSYDIPNGGNHKVEDNGDSSSVIKVLKKDGSSLLKKQWKLPKTGGNELLFTGSMVLLLGVWILVYRKRKNS